MISCDYQLLLAIDKQMDQAWTEVLHSQLYVLAEEEPFGTESALTQHCTGLCECSAVL